CNNDFGQCNAPALPPGVTYVGIAAGEWHTAALRSDGAAVAWGDNRQGQGNVATLPPGVTYVGIAASENHTVALRSDGVVVAWGRNDYGQCNAPVLPRGWNFVGVTAGSYFTAARISVSASYSTFASGCPGSLGIAGLTPSGSLQIGNTLTVVVDHLAQDLAIVMTGLSTTSSAFGPLPLDLGVFGMPGCTGWVSPDAIAVVLGSGNAATFALTVPNEAGLVGITVFQQALVPDFGASNAAGVVVSDAARATVGV